MKEVLYEDDGFTYIDNLYGRWVRPDRFQDLFELNDTSKDINALNMSLKEGMEYLVYSKLQNRYRYNTLHLSMDRKILLDYYKKGILYIRKKDNDKKKKPIRIQRKLFSD